MASLPFNLSITAPSHHALSPLLTTPLLTLLATTLFVLGTLADTATTATLLTNPAFTDANPIINTLFAHIGTTAVIIYKTLLVLTAYLTTTTITTLHTEHTLVLCFTTLGSLWLLAGLHNLHYLL